MKITAPFPNICFCGEELFSSFLSCYGGKNRTVSLNYHWTPSMMFFDGSGLMTSSSFFLSPSLIFVPVIWPIPLAGSRTIAGYQFHVFISAIIIASDWDRRSNFINIFVSMGPWWIIFIKSISKK